MKKIFSLFIILLIFANTMIVNASNTEINNEYETNKQELEEKSDINLLFFNLIINRLNFVRSENENDIQISDDNTNYIVKEGDSLWSISEHFYGDGNKFTDIKNHNNLKSNTIHINQELEIPYINKIDIVLEHRTYSNIECTSIPIEKINSRSDLGDFEKISVDQMNQYIDSWGKPNSPFTGNGAAFIAASEASGLNPLYLFAHASLETGYGEKGYAKRHNYFGIGAFDSNPDNAHNMGNTLEEGLINGALFIKNEYYNKGYISLYDMIYTAPYPYASAKDKWISDIVWIANNKINYIETKGE